MFAQQILVLILEPKDFKNYKVNRLDLFNSNYAIKVLFSSSINYNFLNIVFIRVFVYFYIKMFIFYFKLFCKLIKFYFLFKYNFIYKKKLTDLNYQFYYTVSNCLSCLYITITIICKNSQMSKND